MQNAYNSPKYNIKYTPTWGRIGAGVACMQQTFDGKMFILIFYGTTIVFKDLLPGRSGRIGPV